MNREFFSNAFLLSLCLMLAACSGSAGTGGSSAVSISISQGGGQAGSGSPTLFKAPAAVSSLVFTISASDMQTITETVPFTTGQTATKTFEVPNGTGRLFSVEAKDAGGVVVYQGSETADLTGSAVTLNITMKPATSPVTVTTTLAGQAGITSLVFTITAPDMDTMTRAVTVAASLTFAENFDVPNGAGRTFTIEAKDSAGRAVLRGTAAADLTGAAVTLDVTLSPAVFTGTKLFGTAQDDDGRAIARDGSGNIYVAGITNTTVSNPAAGSPPILINAFFTKFDQYGQLLYSRQIGTMNTAAFAVAADGNGNIIVAGGTGENLDGTKNNDSLDGFVSKFDSLGNHLWTKLIGGAGDDVVNAVAVDASGNIYATGFAGAGSVLPGNQSSGGQDVFVVKMNPSGTSQWTKQYGSTAVDSGEAIAVDSAGSVYIAGLTFGNIDTDLNPQNVNKDASGATADAFVSKIDTFGLLRITGQFGTDDSDQASAVAVGAAGIIYVAGSTSGLLEGQANAGLSDMFLVKFDASSTVPALQFARLIGTTGNDVVNGIALDAAGNVLLAGSTGGAFTGNTSAGGDDSVVVKVSAAGETAWARQTGTQNNDEAKAVLVDAANNLFVAGSTKGVFDGIQSSEFDAFLMMFDASGVKQ